MNMENTMPTSNFNSQIDQLAHVGTVVRPCRDVATLRDVSDILADAARYGTPSIADWPHREVDFRILERVLAGLDHPIEAFGTLFPTVWNDLSAEIRDRIPGNARNNHMRLSARVPRAIGMLRPDLDPWSALQILADVELPTNAGVVGEVRWRAMRDGLKPVEIDNGWIAAQLACGDPQGAKQHRNIYQFLVRLAKQPRVRQSGLLREDLRMPPTARQVRRAVALPSWLQDIYDASDRPTQNGLNRVWRTIVHHGLGACSVEDILALIDTGKLQHDAAQCLEPIKTGSWRVYIQCVRRALLCRVDDASKYSEKVKHR